MTSPAKLSLRLLSAALLATAALLLGGCQGSVHRYDARHDTTLGKKREVRNVHQQDALPGHLRRVALLPLHRGDYDHIEMDTIRQNFLQELLKRNLFEVVQVTPEEMEDLFGEPSFSSVGYLPTKLLGKLHDVYAIDGVMLIDISYYRAYQPVGLGVRAKLLDGHTGDIAWASDAVFDAANPEVSNAARKYFKTESLNRFPLTETRNVLHSPARFSKYVADAVFETIQ